LSLLTLNVLVATDWVIIPVQTEYLALEGLSHMVRTIQRIKSRFNSRLELLGILATLFDGRTNLSQQVFDELRNAFPGKVFSSPINRSVRLSEAPSFGKPILYYDRRSTGAQQYLKLCQEVIHGCEKARIGARS
jgi:chromosome partitioning protein